MQALASGREASERLVARLPAIRRVGADDEHG
jgi:hypothetical protein